MAFTRRAKRTISFNLANGALRLILASLLPLAAYAQSSGGTIRGTISDPSGAVVPAAEVSIAENATGIVTRVSSTNAGLYEALNLPVGLYKVTVRTPAFATAERTGVTLQVGSDTVVDVQLALGTATQSASVSAASASLDLDSSQVAAVDSGRSVRDLPLNGRDWTTLAALQPEVSIVRTENAAGLNVTRGNRGGPSGAAARLGMKRTTLVHKMQRRGITAKRRSQESLRLAAQINEACNQQYGQKVGRHGHLPAPPPDQVNQHV